MLRQSVDGLASVVKAPRQAAKSLG